MKNLLILNYHAIIDDATGSGHYDPVYSIMASELKRHLSLLQKLHIPVITLDEIYKHRNADLVVCLTFDDGHASDFETAFPILEEFGMKGNFFLPIMNIGGNTKRWGEYRKISNAGHLIGAHGVNHLYLSDLSEEGQRHEMEFSREMIEYHLRLKVNHFSLPGGKYNRKTIEIAKSLGYSSVLSTDFGLMNMDQTPYIMHRWSIKVSTAIESISSVLRKENVMLMKMKSMNRLKRGVNQILGNQLIDKINYSMRK